MARAAGIKDEAVLVGLLDRFEIWNPARYEKVKAADAVLATKAFQIHGVNYEPRKITWRGKKYFWRRRQRRRIAGTSTSICRNSTRKKIRSRRSRRKPAPAAAPEVKKVAAPVVATTQKMPAICRQAEPPGRRGPSWTTKLNPFRAPAPVAPALRHGRAGELSLEEVKVVHNDLADADIEIVPVKSRAARAGSAGAAARARSRGNFWANRLMKSSLNNAQCQNSFTNQ